MNLVIVESPTKGNTISKFLGNNYKVMSSYGHIRDLPRSKLGVDTEHDFEVQYLIPKRAKPNAKALEEAAKKADGIILATDEDREGEAIAWHLEQVIKESIKKENEKRAKKKTKKASEPIPLPLMQRIAFHEITESAIKNALASPRDINIDLVNA